MYVNTIVAFLFFCGATNSFAQAEQDKATGIKDENAKEEKAKEEITLEACVVQAVQKSYDIAKQKAGLDIMGSELLGSYVNFLPQISTSFQGSLNQGSSLQQFNANTSSSGTDLIYTPLSTESQSLSGSLTASLNIFDGMSNISNMMASIKNKEATAYSLERAKQDIAYDVSQKFYQALMDEQLVVAAEKNYIAVAATFDQIEQQAKSGVKTEVDLLQQQAEKYNAELQLVQAKNNYEVSYVNLQQAVRLDPKKQYTLKVPFIDTTARQQSLYSDVKYLEKRALENRRDLKAREVLIDRAKWQEVQARSAFFPSLNLRGSIGTNGNYVSRATASGQQITLGSRPPLLEQLANQWSYSIGASISWNLTGIVAAIGLTQSASLQTAQMEYDKEQLRLDITTQIVRGMTGYHAAVKQIQATVKAYEASEKSFNNINERYKAGASMWVEFQNAQRNLFRAQTDMVRALMNLALQKTVLDYAIGELRAEE